MHASALIAMAPKGTAQHDDTGRSPSAQPATDSASAAAKRTGSPSCRPGGGQETRVVSLEAIFLSTFVMIGQNRQAAFQQSRADHDFETQELELKTNTEITRQIHVLTEELHRRFMSPASEQDVKE
jgi:hypothetical protein